MGRINGPNNEGLIPIRLLSYRFGLAGPNHKWLSFAFSHLQGYVWQIKKYIVTNLENIILLEYFVL